MPYVVSGNGDGALTVALSLLIKDFEHDKFTRTFLDFFAGDELRQAADKAFAGKAFEEDAEPDLLAHVLPALQAYGAIDNLRPLLRSDRKITLNAKGPLLAAQKASQLNQCMVLALLEAAKTTGAPIIRSSGEVTVCTETAGGTSLTGTTVAGSPDVTTYKHAILRHGPNLTERYQPVGTLLADYKQHVEGLRAANPEWFAPPQLDDSTFDLFEARRIECLVDAPLQPLAHATFAQERSTIEIAVDPAAHVLVERGAVRLAFVAEQCERLPEPHFIDLYVSPEQIADAGHLNRAFPAAVRRQVLELIEENYHDYGPTLLAEVLLEEHGMKISRETLRQWMIAAGLWLLNRGARKRMHQPRKRMAGYGDLIQVDGSDHDWFEGRGPRCTLMVMVDDATGRIQNLKFFPRENRAAYYQSLASYIADHGRPVRVLTDKHSAVWKAGGSAEFTEALNRLGILHSFAHSPQSKGRVERAHRTLQDRLVKSMRRAVIRNFDEANAHAAKYMKKHNRKFARRAADDNHRRIPPENIDRAFAAQHIRKITKNHIFSFNGDEYVIENLPIEEKPVGSRILISIWLDGTMEVFSGERRLKVRRLPK